MPKGLASPISAPLSTALEILRKHGLATLFACVTLYMFYWIVSETLEDQRAFRREVAAEVHAIGEDLDHLSRIVDLSCEPKRERGESLRGRRD